MSSQRSSPLNNLPQENAAIAAKVKRNLTTGNSDVEGREKGVSKGGKERVKFAEALIRCQMCGRLQKVVFSIGKPPEWHRCIWCKELQPMDGYRVTFYGLGLPTPLTSYEVEARKRELPYNPHH